MLEDIPSDIESDVGDCSDDDNEGGNERVDDVNVGFEETASQEDDIQMCQDEDDMQMWEDEDDIPLSVVRTQLLEKYHFAWSNDTSLCINKNEFVEESGPNVPDSIESPTDLFLHLFPEELISHLTFHTNLYAVQQSGGNHGFIPTDNKEIKVFLGINLLMGIKRLPSYRDYWSSNPLLRDEYISSAMSRDRFSWFLSNFHINDNSTQPRRNDPNYDKLYKLRPLLDTLSQTFLLSLKPHENQAVDESMIRFKGRSSIRQYMPMKPIKRGYKVWIRADSSGYVCQFQIYTGKSENTTEKNLGKRVVLDLTRPIVGKFFKVYFDNYFNSLELQRDLLRDNIYACGTARKGRKYIPTDLHDDKGLQRGDFDYRVSTDGIVCLKWMDKKSILFLDNFHNPSDTQTVNRKKKDGSQEEISCPLLVKDYNKNMGYVDKFDMLKSLYEIDRKSRKWWHRICWYFLDATVVNSYIIFQQRMSSKITLKQFRLSVAAGLIGASPKTSSRGRKSQTKINKNKYKTLVPLEIRFDKCAHMPARGTSLRCAYCSTRKEPHRTCWKCVTCNVGLCLNEKRNCFALYHTR